MAHGLDAIDWSAPWLAPFQPLGQELVQAVRRGASVCEALNQVPSMPVRFVAQGELPHGMAYEDYIFRSRQCPTRDGLHDFFNGLCWWRFPQTKRQLNRIQAAQIAADGIQCVRGPVRDAVTLLDENGAVFLGPQALWDALCAKDWERLFVQLRPLWAQARLVLLGHALLEKLVVPRKGMTAHVYRGPATLMPLEALDDWLARDLTAAQLACKPFAPLPVLGVPGWWSANEDTAFYRDPAVFRAPVPASSGCARTP